MHNQDAILVVCSVSTCTSNTYTTGVWQINVFHDVVGSKRKIQLLEILPPRGKYFSQLYLWCVFATSACDYLCQIMN